jgi:hypothetical protein
MAWWRWMAREEVGEVAAGMADTTTVADIGMRGIIDGTAIGAGGEAVGTRGR